MSKVVKPIRAVANSPVKSFKWARGLLQKAIAEKPTGKPTWDVWQWTKRKYRIRSVILLLVNAALFAGLGCFTFWLRTGQLSPFFTQQYQQFWWAAFDPTAAQQTTLLDFLLYPIPVDQVPMMVVIVGLVLASLSVIPILVSMLYRFGFSLIFTLILAVVAVMPWMAFTVTICCYLVRWKPLQFSFRYATGLIALLPLVIYYALSTRNASLAAHLPWVEMAKLYLPCMLALISACVVMAVVLTIAKAVNYRPGAIAPLLAVMFAIPVILFETNVGRDELYYRLIEGRFGSGSKAYFADQIDADGVIREVALERLMKLDDPQATLDGLMEQTRLALQLGLTAGNADRNRINRLINEAFALQKHIAVDECNTFLAKYPKSRYIPNVLYLKARAMDMRLDEGFYFSEGQIILRHYHDFPRTATKVVWQRLYEDFGDSPPAGLAGYQLAMLEGRGGNIDRGIELLDAVIERFGSYKKENSKIENTSSWRVFLAKGTASDTLDVAPATAAHQARKLRKLLAGNRDPQYKDLPLKKLLTFNPHHEMYRNNLWYLLAEIVNYYPKSSLQDNIELMIAITQLSRSRRIEELKSFLAKYSNIPDTDTMPRARYELGVVFQTDNRPAEAKALFEDVIRYHPQSPWEVEANRRLGQLSMGLGR
ncbi:MAG: tetratricopeptide repeat protein [Planctomycetota bacterium]|jgi:hypothetical protein